ncbi:uncharacterized protein LOC134271089 [Saccostrea cucullata]|uniref:uncharacterized protein LOC134271089 n=1 Tax=Saccostrea cuccullata TaxID=36930 RepID=UPI002ED0CA42
MTERAETVKSTLNFVQNLDLSSFENIVERVRHLERFVISTQKSVDHLETYASKPVTWLSYFKKCPIPASENFPDAYVKPSINLSALDRDNVIQMFGEVEVINTGKKCIGNECLFEVFSDVVLNETVEVDGIWKSLHISCVTPERFWTSNHRKLLLVLKNDRVLYREKDVLIDADFPCVHSVTRTGELIYIDKRHNVKKVEREKKLHVTRILIARTHPWKPCSLYCSNLNDDLLIGMWSRKNDASMVARFDRSGRPKQNVRYNEQGKPLYKRALYITENQNGDVIVSDLWNGVVVVNGEGKYRFSYKSPPSGQRLSPHGVCTDVLMHVLICDYNTNCVQMIDKDGNFLRFLLTNRNDMNEPRSLFYDNKNHLLWVGSQDKNTKLSIYRYINRKNLY